jgi:hypothetical protein
VGWPATDRYGLPSAPGGLGFVQDLLNTRRIQRVDMPDLLADLARAQSWLDDSVENWSATTRARHSQVILSEDDLSELHDLRTDLNAWLGLTDQGHDGSLVSRHPTTPMKTFPSASVAARIGPDGEVLLEPRGEGSRRVRAVALIEIFAAQQLNTWRRLKVCRNDQCAVAFYDQSRNNSGA